MVNRHGALSLVLVLLLVASSCSSDSPTKGGRPPLDPIVPSTTVVLDQATSNRLFYASEERDSLLFEANTSSVSQWQAGTIIASAKDQGFLRKVTAVEEVGGAILVTTESASLAEAFQQATIELNRDLTLSDIDKGSLRLDGVSVSPGPGANGEFYIKIEDVVLYDYDGNPTTRNDQVRANGELTLAPRIEFRTDIRDYRLEYLSLIYSQNQSARLELEATVRTPELHRAIDLKLFSFTPIVIMVGPIPVVLTPTVSAKVGVTGEASIGLVTAVTQESDLAAGVEYVNGTWEPVQEFTTGFDFEPPQIFAEAKLKGYLGPQLNLLLYGVVGPYVIVRGYGELQVHPFETPWWVLYGGVEAAAGVRVDVFWRSIVDHEFPTLIGYRAVIAQSQGVPYGEIRGAVKDALTGQTIPEVRVRLYDGGAMIAEDDSRTDGSYVMSVPVGSGYRLEASKTGYLPAVYENIDVALNGIRYLETILQVDQAHSGTGSVGGTIVNALTGQGVAGVLLTLREGINTQTGPILEQQTTGGYGSYLFNDIQAGNYSVSGEKEGFNPILYTLVCVGGQSRAAQDVPIMPILPPGETRVVLTWGVYPSDLDSHLTGPLPDGSRFHMYYPLAQANDGSPWPDIVQLDLDDVSSYGPETTTLIQQVDGLYRFTVHDFTNRNSTWSSAMSESGAEVKVYRGSEMVGDFHVPTNVAGTTWVVFEMEGNDLFPINQMGFEDESWAITKPGGLPPK